MDYLMYNTDNQLVKADKNLLKNINNPQAMFTRNSVCIIQPNNESLYRTNEDIKKLEKDLEAYANKK